MKLARFRRKQVLIAKGLSHRRTVGMALQFHNTNNINIMYIDYTQHKFLHINVTSSNKFVHKNVCKIIQTRKMSITRLEKSAKKYNLSEKKFNGSVIKAATNHKSEAKCVCSKHNFNHCRYVVLILLHT